MKTFNPFGPSLGKGKLSKKFIKCINYEIDKLTINKKNDYSAILASQIKNEIKPKKPVSKSSSIKKL